MLFKPQSDSPNQQLVQLAEVIRAGDCHNILCDLLPELPWLTMINLDK